MAHRIFLALFLLLASSAEARAEEPLLARVVEVSLEAQPLGAALIEFSKQSGTQVVVGGEQVTTHMAPALRGTMSLGDALGRLLDGTDLEVRVSGPDTIAIGPRRTTLDDLLGDIQAEPPDAAPARRAVRTAGVAPRTAPAPPVNRRVVEEILVTANRRSQDVQDVVGGLRVLVGEDLEQTGSSSFADYVFKVPGLDFVDDGASKKVSVRGVSNMFVTASAVNGTASPVGIYLDDTPIQGNGILPDLDLYDLERIEVLKGPQGTLYGEGAQGGAVRMLLRSADASGLSAKGDFGFGQTVNGSGFDHYQKAAINVPIHGSWAARVVGSRRVDQGFVDFVERGTRGENDVTNLMARLHVGGEVSNGLEARLMLLHQRERVDQFPTVQFEAGELANVNREPQFAHTDFTLGALTLDYDLGWATLTSSTSAFINEKETLARLPFAGLIVTEILGGPEPPPVFGDEWLETLNEQLAIAQEVRLVSAGGRWLDWVAGFFYRRRTNDFDYLIINDVSQDPPPVGPGLYGVVGVETFEQFALFGEATLELPWNLELGLGLRGFREKVGTAGEASFRGALYAISVSAGEPDGTLPHVSFDVTTTALTPKASLTWFADDSRMLYLSIAQGVRSGGTNTTALESDVPPFFDPDTVWSYEVGAKTQWLDGMLTANVAAFHNDWNDLQVGTTQDAVIGGTVPAVEGVVLNVGQAFSQGVELDVLADPLPDWTFGFSLLVARGKIVEGDDLQTIPDGTPIPQLARLSYSAFASHTASNWPVFGFIPTAQLETQFTGARIPQPPALGVLSTLPSFQTYNALVTFASEHWELGLGVANLTDERPVYGVNILETETRTIGRPRSWRVRLAFRF